MNGAVLREHVDSHCGDKSRVTVFWSCGGKVNCTTGKIVFFYDDILAIKGFVPTFKESLRDEGCKDRNSLELVTFIDVESICAVVLDVPECRQASLSACCKSSDDIHGHENADADCA